MSPRREMSCGWQRACHAKLIEIQGGRIPKHRNSTRAALAVLLLGSIVASGCADSWIQDGRSLLFVGFYKSEIWGFIAGLGTTVAAVPDLAAMLRCRSSAGMNPTMAGVLAMFQVIWVYYGLLIDSRPIIAWNLIAVAINSVSVGTFVYFDRREHRRPTA